jgi:hypothetical protein
VEENLCGGPWINKGRGDIGEVPDVPRRQCGVARENDASDHGVAHVAGAALHFSRGPQGACVLCGLGVEGSDAMMNTAQQFLKVVPKSGSPSPAWHDLEPETNFKNSD